MNKATINGLSKKYGETEAVINLTLSIYSDEILAIVGPSGCGKTTLLKMISGLEAPTSGEILIDGDVVYSSEKGICLVPEKRNIALVFQNYAIWPHMTVFDNIAYPLKVKRVDKVTIQKSVEEIVELVKLSGKETRYPHELSGGEKQRVALARALVMRPKILLLDEPFSNLDAKLRMNMQYEIKRIRRELGLTIVHVTHDQSEAMGLADRIAVMNKGQIVQIASPKDVYERPETLFVSQFIGDSNDVTSLYEGDEDDTRVNENEAYVVRPKDVVLKKTGQGSLSGKVLSVIYRGSFIEYIVGVKGLEVKAEGKLDNILEVGEIVSVDFSKVKQIRRG